MFPYRVNPHDEPVEVDEAVLFLVQQSVRILVIDLGADVPVCHQVSEHEVEVGEFDAPLQGCVVHAEDLSSSHAPQSLWVVHFQGTERQKIFTV